MSPRPKQTNRAPRKANGKAKAERPSNRIAARMEELGLKNQGLARLVEEEAARQGQPMTVYERQVFGWKSGEHAPQRFTRSLLAKVLETTVDDLFPPS